MRQSKLILFLFLVAGPSISHAQCPSLDSYQSQVDQDWELTQLRLGEVFDRCLLSSEYFSLLGAAQLNTGRLAEAMESLERSLLLDPDNGAALIDYAQALLQDGQLFAAIELNKILLARQDAPPELSEQLRQRQLYWTSLTRRTDWQLDISGGFDDNLNGSPDSETVTLTLSGEPILLKLNENYQATRGPFVNGRLLASHLRLSPEHQDNYSAQIRGRFSDDPSSDAVQLTGRFARALLDRGSPAQFDTGVTHLLFGGESLFSGADFRYQHQLGSLMGCRTYLRGALQHQVWHQQRRLDGFELKASAGTSCNLSTRVGQQLGLETSLLHNSALEGNRLGGDRDGWQITAQWQLRIGGGVLSTQILHTSILDREGFSVLLENNARRSISRTSALMQYREPVSWLGGGAFFTANLYHQGQRSNLDLFKTTDTSIEFGFSWEF